MGEDDIVECNGPVKWLDKNTFLVSTGSRYMKVIAYRFLTRREISDLERASFRRVEFAGVLFCQVPENDVVRRWGLIGPEHITKERLRSSKGVRLSWSIFCDY